MVEFAQLAIGDISADDPRISAMYADLRGLPHMLVMLVTISTYPSMLVL